MFPQEVPLTHAVSRPLPDFQRRQHGRNNRSAPHTSSLFSTPLRDPLCLPSACPSAGDIAITAFPPLHHSEILASSVLLCVLLCPCGGFAMVAVHERGLSRRLGKNRWYVWLLACSSPPRVMGMSRVPLAHWFCGVITVMMDPDTVGRAHAGESWVFCRQPSALHAAGAESIRVTVLPNPRGCPTPASPLGHYRCLQSRSTSSFIPSPFELYRRMKCHRGLGSPPRTPYYENPLSAARLG